MNNVLIISFISPSDNAAGSGRLRGLVEYLPESGYVPRVLVPDKPNSNQSGQYDDCVTKTFYPGDIGQLTKDYMRSTTLSSSRTPSNKSNNHQKTVTCNNFINFIVNLAYETTCFPDSRRLWIPQVIDHIQENIELQKFDAILTTSPPHSSHIVGNHLARESDLPWIADLRDLWTQNHYYDKFYLNKKREQSLEKRVLSSCEVLTTTTEDFEKRLKRYHNTRSETVYNGFSNERYVKSLDHKNNTTEDFTITYTGSLYEGRRNPRPVFKCLSQLIGDKLSRKHLSIRFYGDNNVDVINIAKEFTLEDIVLQKQRIPQNEAVKRQRESQLLLSIQWDHPREKGVIPGKVFEYFGSCRPILATGGPSGELGSILKKTQTGTFAESVEQMKEFIMNRYTEYNQYGYVPYEGKRARVVEYSHKKMASRFAELFDSL